MAVHEWLDIATEGWMRVGYSAGVQAGMRGTAWCSCPPRQPGSLIAVPSYVPPSFRHIWASGWEAGWYHATVTWH